MQTRFLIFPPIEKHGVIGDRRTAALVAADGTIDWLCLPDYDDDVICGALLDPATGGFCRFGPEKPVFGEQAYKKKALVCFRPGLTSLANWNWPILCRGLNGIGRSPKKKRV